MRVRKLLIQGRLYSYTEGVAVSRKIKVDLYNRIASFSNEEDCLDLRNYFCFRVPNYRFMPAYKYGRWDGFINLMSRGKVSSGLFLAKKEKIEQDLKCKFEVTDLREITRFKPVTEVSDRDYQNKCVEAMATSISGGIVIGGTGIGKTKIAGMYFKRLKGNGLFVVDELQLLAQTKRALEVELGEPIGEIGNQVFVTERITVATIQTLHIHKADKKYLQWHKTLKAMIIDEVHIALNRRNSEVVKKIKPPVVFGLTATLELAKDHVAIPAFALCGPVLFEYYLEQGTKEGFLAPGIVCAVLFPQEGLDEDYHFEYQEMIVDSKARNKCVIALVREAYKRGKKTVLLVHRVAHLKYLSEELSDIPHRKIFGEKEVATRLKSTEKFDEGRVKLILANTVFKKGIDIHSIDCIVECSALKSKNDAVQKFGRGVRLSEEKSGLIFFDLNDRALPGLVRKDDIFNRFQLSAKARLRAYKDKGIPVVKVSWAYDASEVFDVAEKKLGKLIKKTEGKVA